jgi:hypothetical protein
MSLPEVGEGTFLTETNLTGHIQKHSQKLLKIGKG